MIPTLSNRECQWSIRYGRVLSIHGSLPQMTCAPKVPGGPSDRRDFASRPDKKRPGNADQPFVRSTSRPCGELSGKFGDVLPDDGEVSVSKFEDVRAGSSACTLLQSGARLHPKSSNEHGWRLTIVIAPSSSKRTIVIGRGT